MLPLEENLYLPKDPKPINKDKLQQLLKKEREYYLTKTEKSKENFITSIKTYP